MQDWKWAEKEVQNYLKEKKVFTILYITFLPERGVISVLNKIWKVGIKFSKITQNYPKLWEKAKQMEEEAKKDNAQIQTWRTDGSLKSREKEFARKKANPNFDFDWNDDGVSCFCK